MGFMEFLDKMLKKFNVFPKEPAETTPQNQDSGEGKIIRKVRIFNSKDGNAKK
jgi:hypothetical protein